jgi:glycosyltransferase involved in cell wall biosynthesis
MVKVLTIGSDRTIFEAGSASRARVVEYAGLFDELHIVVLTTKKFQLPVNVSDPNQRVQIAPNSWIYPTSSSSRWFYVSDAIRVGKKILTGNPGLAAGWVVSGQDPFESGLAAFKLCRSTSAKLHIQVHTDFLSSFFRKQSWLNRIRLLLAKKILPKAGAIRVVSERIRKSLVNLNRRLETKITVLPIFVDLEKIRSGAERFDFRETHPDWTAVILSAGRLEPEKNFPLVLAVFKNIAQKYPRIGLAVAGSGRQQSALKQLVAKWGLAGNVLFLDQVANLSPFYRGATLFFQASNYEGYGMALVEAAASGLPAVTTDVGVAAELLINGQNGFICPVGDAKCLTEKILQLIEDNELRQRFSQGLKDNFPTTLFPTKENYLALYKRSVEDALGKGIDPT